ncbi:hypothetical protein [Brevundimonas bacteroides]|uniref:hypothetical protein n=1 Tax=Brevundimonas bacteroides TaxID=74311 RepID=UPI000496E565|nr:hypothetical protein [Brevundimonas bacteroides]
MVWVWRACLGLLIAAYAGWLVWPLVQPLTAGGGVADALPAVTEEAGRLGGFLPSLWLASAALYLIAAVLTAARVGAAPGAYFLAFGAEVIQRALLQATPGATISDTPARIAAALQPLVPAIEPGPASLAALFAVGLLVVMTGTWRGQKGHALTRHWTQPPVYA